MRKVNEANQPKIPTTSPAEFSKLKHDREMKLQEKHEQYRQQMIAQQRVSYTITPTVFYPMAVCPLANSTRRIWLLNVLDNYQISNS